ncbi:hypothetical protein HDV00_005308 [Rhizophlyctis rosea]|nr:hypothetical protein HDV00_005308 [Rhizophlyctis rosea]
MFSAPASLITALAPHKGLMFTLGVVGSTLASGLALGERNLAKDPYVAQPSREHAYDKWLQIGQDQNLKLYSVNHKFQNNKPPVESYMDVKPTEV